MSINDEYLRTKFTVASHLDNDQKQLIEIRKIKDEEARERLLEMRRQRNEAVAGKAREQEEERKRIAAEEVRKRIQGRSEDTLEMPGGMPVSLHERERRIRESVNQQWREKHDIELERLRRDWNRQIDAELARAQEREREGPSDRERRDRERVENTRDITRSRDERER